VECFKKSTGSLIRFQFDGAEKNAPEKSEVTTMKKVNRLKIAGMIFVLSLVALAFPSGAKADEWNKKTKVTFSAPVEIPGVGAQILPAGTYTFKLMDSQSDRHIVQVLSEDETHVYSTILAIPNFRLKPTDHTVMTFAERAAGQPQAIRAWFYPGNQWGEEFVYPKSRAMELAKVTDEPVLAMPLETEPTVAALQDQPVETVQPAAEAAPVAEAAAEPTPAPVETAAAAEEPLPHTASTMPLVGLVGLLSLGAGLTLLIFTRRSA